MDATVTGLLYSQDTFYFLVMGAFVMWMAAGFAMLEAGLVRAKNTTEILTKNVALFAVACMMFMVFGYNFMYPGDLTEGYGMAGMLLSHGGGMLEGAVSADTVAYAKKGLEIALENNKAGSLVETTVHGTSVFSTAEITFYESLRAVNEAGLAVGDKANELQSYTIIVGEAAKAAAGDSTYSPNSDFFFQVVFVATAMSIVSGAVAERMKLWSFLLFAVFLTAIIYPLQGFWNWGGGILTAATPIEVTEGMSAAAIEALRNDNTMPFIGYFDYAGSGTVHLCGAIAALAGVIFLGARKGKYGKNGEVNAIPGANLPLATLGTFILWLGWFGFNGGSELSVNTPTAANNVAAVFVNTNMAAAAGALAALLVARVLFGKADLTMLLNGALAGLVSITASPANPSPLLAVAIGAVGGVLVVFSILALDKFKLDDPVGAISVHGTAGIWGVIAVVFSADYDNTSYTKGGEEVFWSFSDQLLAQLAGVGLIIVFTFIASSIVWLAIKAIFGLRVTEEEEYNGVDLSECGMEAYPEFTK